MIKDGVTFITCDKLNTQCVALIGGDFDMLNYLVKLRNDKVQQEMMKANIDERDDELKEHRVTEEDVMNTLKRQQSELLDEVGDVVQLRFLYLSLKLSHAIPFSVQYL